VKSALLTPEHSNDGPPLSRLPPLEVRPREAAYLLSISTRKVRLLAQRGELERVGTGRLARITYSSIQAYHERRKKAA
jgi:excisionase family DNA binding protein